MHYTITSAANVLSSIRSIQVHKLSSLLNFYNFFSKYYSTCWYSEIMRVQMLYSLIARTSFFSNLHKLDNYVILYEYEFLK